MKIEDIKKEFEADPDLETLEWTGPCYDCGKETRIEIVAPPPGVEVGLKITGGAVFAPWWDETETRIKCDSCYAKKQEVNRENEVYSRIVGYLRPVKNWNKAKQAEFHDRKMFQA